ncbi:MAG: 50S ribosomal protein L7 [Clostridiales bacterium]|jgi:ribosomal protein L7Ae-like RNA K-turn-binding protein|nr:50S ribosomal protein L7 [Clostridiales bacterium]
MDKLLSFLGICKKAGAIEIGEETVGAVVRKGRAVLILTASDAAKNAVKKAENYARSGNCVLIQLPYTKQTLGEMLGRRVCAIMAVTNLSMAVGLAEKLSEERETYKEAYNRLLDKYKRRKHGRRNGRSSKAIGRNANGEV